MKIAYALSLLASTASAFVVSPSCPRSSISLNLYDRVEDAIAEANRICAADPSSPECRVAWDIVEELEAADSHKGGYTTTDVSPDIVAFMGSLDILMRKIDGKMDQLKATTDKLEEMGSTDPSIAELGARAIEMKYALANARMSLSQ
mmetsp:Transcript_11461/g.14189  ORF Transcript_11461/g.14189 Transcript_11461/m.14189 type:complete len:147 (-) Transcript_11461:244-684(-)